MTQYLDKLLAGATVEWKTLGEVAIKISSGGTPNTGVSSYYDGDIPWLRTQEVGSGDIWDTGIKITELGLKNSSAKIIPKNCVIVAMYGATVGKVGINKIPLCTNQACANIQLNEEIVHYRYVYHFLLRQYEYIKSLGAGSQTNINAQIVKNLQIPIPPLHVQSEIVRILDTFTELSTELANELANELALRKQQYAYYREQLLSFEGKDVAWKTLGEVFDMKAGHHISASDIMNVANSEYPFPCFGGNGIRGYVKKKNHNGTHLLIGRQGALCGNVQRFDGEFYATEHAVVVKSNGEINMGFAFHLLTLMNLNQYASKSAQPGLAVGNLERLKIPIPPLAEQLRIVSILDQFDALTASISEGLPKEIALRKQQYEYYREQLLSFPKEEAVGF